MAKECRFLASSHNPQSIFERLNDSRSPFCLSTVIGTKLNTFVSSERRWQFHSAKPSDTLSPSVERQAPGYLDAAEGHRWEGL